MTVSFQIRRRTKRQKGVLHSLARKAQGRTPCGSTPQPPPHLPEEKPLLANADGTGGEGSDGWSTAAQLPISFAFSLYPDGFVLHSHNPNEGPQKSTDPRPGPTHPYDRTTYPFLEAINAGKLPLELLDGVPCTFVEGRVVCEVHDYRHCRHEPAPHTAHQAPPDPLPPQHPPCDLASGESAQPGTGQAKGSEQDGQAGPGQVEGAAAQAAPDGPALQQPQAQEPGQSLPAQPQGAEGAGEEGSTLHPPEAKQAPQTQKEQVEGEQEEGRGAGSASEEAGQQCAGATLRPRSHVVLLQPSHHTLACDADQLAHEQGLHNHPATWYERRLMVESLMLCMAQGPLSLSPAAAGPQGSPSTRALHSAHDAGAWARRVVSVACSSAPSEPEPASLAAPPSPMHLPAEFDDPLPGVGGLSPMGGELADAQMGAEFDLDLDSGPGTLAPAVLKSPLPGTDLIHKRGLRATRARTMLGYRRTEHWEADPDPELEGAPPPPAPPEGTDPAPAPARPGQHPPGPASGGEAAGPGAGKGRGRGGALRLRVRDRKGRLRPGTAAAGAGPPDAGLLPPDADMDTLHPDDLALGGPALPHLDPFSSLGDAPGPDPLALDTDLVNDLYGLPSVSMTPNMQEALKGAWNRTPVAKTPAAKGVGSKLKPPAGGGAEAGGAAGDRAGDARRASAWGSVASQALLLSIVEQHRAAQEPKPKLPRHFKDDLPGLMGQPYLHFLPPNKVAEVAVAEDAATNTVSAPQSAMPSKQLAFRPAHLLTMHPAEGPGGAVAEGLAEVRLVGRAGTPVGAQALHTLSTVATVHIDLAASRAALPEGAAPPTPEQLPPQRGAVPVREVELPPLGSAADLAEFVSSYKRLAALEGLHLHAHAIHAIAPPPPLLPAHLPAASPAHPQGAASKQAQQQARAQGAAGAAQAPRPQGAGGGAGPMGGRAAMAQPSSAAPVGRSNGHGAGAGGRGGGGAEYAAPGPAPGPAAAEYRPPGPAPTSTAGPPSTAALRPAMHHPPHPSHLPPAVHHAAQLHLNRHSPPPPSLGPMPMQMQPPSYHPGGGAGGRMGGGMQHAAHSSMAPHMKQGVHPMQAGSHRGAMIPPQQPGLHYASGPIMASQPAYPSPVLPAQYQAPRDPPPMPTVPIAYHAPIVPNAAPPQPATSHMGQPAPGYPHPGNIIKPHGPPS